jgi:hypothetical protein
MMVSLTRRCFLLSTAALSVGCVARETQATKTPVVNPPMEANRSGADHSGRGCLFDRRASSVLVLACSLSMMRLT